MNAVDTNILVYAVDEDEPAKRQQARDLLRQIGQTEPPLLMWQVLGEFLACLRRWEDQRNYDANRSRRYFQLITSHMHLVFPSLTAAATSFDLRNRYSLSHWDSMLLAACIDAGVNKLYSEDMDDGMTYDSVTVINSLCEFVDLCITFPANIVTGQSRHGALIAKRSGTRTAL